jgi:hypothetical protein
MKHKIFSGLALLLGIYFIAIAVMGFIGAESMVKTFEAIGIGQWLRYVTAVCQLLGGVMLLASRTRLFGAVIVVCVLIGAVIARIGFMHATPLPAVILLAVAGVVLWHALTQRGKAQA